MISNIEASRSVRKSSRFGTMWDPKKPKMPETGNGKEKAETDGLCFSCVHICTNYVKLHPNYTSSSLSIVWQLLSSWLVINRILFLLCLILAVCKISRTCRAKLGFHLFHLGSLWRSLTIPKLCRIWLRSMPEGKILWVLHDWGPTRATKRCALNKMPWTKKSSTNHWTS